MTGSYIDRVKFYIARFHIGFHIGCVRSYKK